MALDDELRQRIIAGDQQKVKDLVRTLLDKGNDPTGIISKGLMPGMSVVGDRMKTGEMFIPEVIAAAKAMNIGMELLKPLIVGEITYTGKVVMGQVKGDLHSIGRKFVNLMLESAGFAVLDLGEDVTADKLVKAVEREQPDILGLSALLTTTMAEMGNVIEALKRNDLRDKVQVMVGGAPVTQRFADSIEADGYAPDAILAVDKAKQLVGQG